MKKFFKSWLFAVLTIVTVFCAQETNAQTITITTADSMYYYKDSITISWKIDTGGWLKESTKTFIWIQFSVDGWVETISNTTSSKKLGKLTLPIEGDIMSGSFYDKYLDKKVFSITIMAGLKYADGSIAENVDNTTSTFLIYKSPICKTKDTSSITTYQFFHDTTVTSKFLVKKKYTDSVSENNYVVTTDSSIIRTHSVYLVDKRKITCKIIGHCNEVVYKDSVSYLGLDSLITKKYTDTSHRISVDSVICKDKDTSTTMNYKIVYDTSVSKPVLYIKKSYVDSLGKKYVTLDSSFVKTYTVYKMKIREYTYRIIGHCNNIVYKDSTANSSVDSVLVYTYEYITDHFMGVAPQAQQQGLRIYPNPCRGFLYLQNPKSGMLQIRSMDGCMVLKEAIGERETKIDVSLFAPGVYFMTLETTDGTFTEKLVIQ